MSKKTQAEELVEAFKQYGEKVEILERFPMHTPAKKWRAKSGKEEEVAELETKINSLTGALASSWLDSKLGLKKIGSREINPISEWKEALVLDGRREVSDLIMWAEQLQGWLDSRGRSGTMTVL